jgi:hypothetical protein
MDSVASMEMTGVSFPESIENVLLFRGGLDIHTGKNSSRLKKKHFASVHLTHLMAVTIFYCF